MEYKKYYLDKNGNFVSKDEAYKIIYQEIDDEGNIINETYQINETDDIPKNDNYVLSESAQEDLEAIRKQFAEYVSKTQK